MKKAVYTLLISLAVVALMLTLIPVVTSQAVNIKVLDYSYYIDNTGILDVVGVVQNQGPNIIQAVVLMGSVEPQDGSSPVTSGCQVWASYLNPNEKAPFYMEFYPPQTGNGWYGAGVGNVQIDVFKADPVQKYQYPDLKIVNTKASIGKAEGLNGAYVVNGEVQNVGTQTATNISLTASFYNSGGKVVGVGYTNYLTPANLSPSGTVSFQIAALDLNQTLVPADLKIKSYLLRVESQSPLLTSDRPIITPNPNDQYPVTPIPSFGNDQTPIPGPVDSNSGGSSSLNQTITYVAVAAGAVVLVILAFLSIRRIQKPGQTAKEAAKSRKKRS